MARRALVVGVDHYSAFDDLPSCGADAAAMVDRLSRNVDGSKNYDCVLRCSSSGNDITRSSLRNELRELFAFNGEILFYFSGHGSVDSAGGWLATSDAKPDDIGITMDEVLSYANGASPRPRDILIVLDCCYGGNLGSPATLNSGTAGQLSALRNNTTVLAASLPNQPALAGPNLSAFTSALVDGLDGGAADHLGFVTASSLYAYAERRFNAWEQRPIFKSNITDVTIIRHCAPLVELHRLKQLPALFPDPHYQFQLDPEYEPQDQDGNLPTSYNVEKYETSRLLKTFRNVGLVKSTVLDEDFYYSARLGHSVELTLRGQEYWHLIRNDKI
jgi:hypothetical protein